MPYFPVLPLFLLAVAGFVTLTVVCSAVPGLRPGLPYAWRVRRLSPRQRAVFALCFVPGALQAIDAHPEPGSARNGRICRVPGIRSPCARSSRFSRCGMEHARPGA